MLVATKNRLTLIYLLALNVMNIILFTQQELADGVELDDHRAAHVRNVLSISDGHTFDAGVINGMRGKAKFGPAKDGKLEIDFETTEPSSELYPINVVVGLSRPQTCRFVLRSLACLGVNSIEFVKTESGEKSYASSQLWTSGEYLNIVTTAVSQSFETRLPEIRLGRTLNEAIGDNTNADSPQTNICLDNYEATTSLATTIDSAASSPIRLLIGSERGWTDSERSHIRDRGFVLASMGSRVLRVETAVVAAVSTLLAKQFWINESGTLSTRCD